VVPFQQSLRAPLAVKKQKKILAREQFWGNFEGSIGNFSPGLSIYVKLERQCLYVTHRVLDANHI
jgi:hypothetical protein